ncbi:methionine ABC transporter ATP-binding protein [Anoxybacter fermentans]|uniref:Methionine ABC transporter ATP-binding protein n=1 Tax=Anoxybacter fermentans TaxID=1323375 RepID=A0A3Q9HNM5_9FIRM|nr:methionine ABC transporter ATP-binding protein [Anoxybacter fermentans]AZR72009.1 methionine ABC transporter ATP-binding protein [Anoxybacter fermentans]
MIQIKDLYKVYEGNEKVEAVKGVNLTIKKGEIFGIIGASGAGKSTLIRCINLLEVPTAGQIFVDGVELTGLARRELRKARQKIGMIFQHFNLLSSRTVAENVEFPLEIVGVPKERRKKRVKELLELVGLSNRADHYPAQLSGGQKQRVGIARALANEPKVLLCDEATSALDPATTRSILKLIKEINQQLGLTVVLITHEMDVIREICDRVAVMDNGQILEVGEVNQIFVAPKSPITRELLGQVKLKLDPEILNGVGEGWVLKVIFIGPSAKEPVISQLIQRYQLTVNILAGNIKQLHDESFGELVIKVEGDENKIRQAISELLKKELKVEVLRYGSNVRAAL